MNMNEQYFLILRGPKRRIIKAAGRYETAEGADLAGQAQSKDYDVVRGDGLAALGAEELMALFNAMAAKKDQVTVFDTAERGAQRFVHMYDMANGGEYDTPPEKKQEDQPTNADSSAQENETMDTQTEAGEATKKVKKAKGKKAQAKKAKGKSKKTAAKKTNGHAKKANSASGPREGSVAHFVVERFRAGDELQDVIKAAVKKFPDSKAGETGYVSWHRWNAKKKGWLK